MRPVALLSFTAWYLRRFVAANVVVAGHVLRPRLALAPVVLTYELRCRTDAEVASFVALVGLTPGTLVVDRADRKITVHAMHGDEAGERAALRDLEDRMLAARRGPGRPA